ncbi:MAG TPA: VOC family protein [Methyloceanibacter sp.]|nr:VOC family protein [Methyloceanibacter sp.]
MVRVVGIDHLAVRVSDYEKSKAFYGKLFPFLGFKVLGKYGDMIGWTNGKTRYWIGQAEAEAKERGYRIGDIGFHHYAFELRSRKDVDDLEAFLKREGAEIVDPADEYYDDYYAVFFLDPDGLKLEGMKWGEATAKAKAARKRSAKRGSAKSSAAAKTSAKSATAANAKKTAKLKKAAKTQKLTKRRAK